MTRLLRYYFLVVGPPNQRFLVIESLKSPFRPPSIGFSGPILIFLHITGPRKQLEGCRLEKEGPFSTEHTGRSRKRVNNMTYPFKHTVVHLQVRLFLPYYGDTSAHTYKQLKGVLLWDTLLGHPEQEIKVKTKPPNCGDTSRPPYNGLEVSTIWHTLVGDTVLCLQVPTLHPNCKDTSKPLQRRLKVSRI